MSDFLGIKSFAIAQSIYALLNHVEKDGLIDEVVEALDKVADQNLGGRSEAVQERLILKVLLPLCRELLKENQGGYISILENEKYRLLGMRGQQPEVDRRVSGRGLEAQPKH